MSKNTYYEYMALLRSRDPRPPFNTLQTLIETASPATKSISKGFLLSATSAVLAVVALTVWWFMPQGVAAIADANIVPVHVQFASQHVRLISPPQTITCSVNRTTVDNTEPVATDTNDIAISACVAKDIVLRQPDTITLHQFEPDEIKTEDSPRFSIFVGGSAARQISANANFQSNDLTDAFGGIGYQLSEHFTVRLLGGQAVFRMPSRSTVLSYHDTSFVIGVRPYNSVIGRIEQSPIPETRHTYWLGGSAVYAMGDEWRPFAEIGCAASTQGLMLRQSLGISHDLTQSFEAQIFAGCSQLQTSSLWLNKINLSAALGYRF